MSSSRVITWQASLVWMVLSTLCPVSAARQATSTVARSRISPTRMTSGSCRSSERRPAAKLRPISSCTWVWVMPGSEYSMGSSRVAMFSASRSSDCKVAYSVVVLPLPVGPATR